MWNLTYLLLQKTKSYRQQLELFYNRKMKEAWQLRDSDREQLDVIMYILEIFYSATKLFSNCKYPTTHIFILEIFFSVSCFAEHKNSNIYRQFMAPMKFFF